MTNCQWLFMLGRSFDNICKHCNHNSKSSSQSTDTSYFAKPYAHPAGIVK